MKFRRRRVGHGKRADTQLPEISLTPLIDTAFTLLIIVMVTAPMMQNSLKISLPKTKSATNDKKVPNKIIVSINGKGKIFIGDQQIADNKFTTVLAGKVARSQDKTVIVKGEKSLKYDKIIQVLDQVNSVKGVQNVALAAELSTKL